MDSYDETSKFILEFIHEYILSEFLDKTSNLF
jgi:hypothetical protein